MGTHATIAVEHENGTVTEVYVHWDGYLGHVGKMLVEHYNSLELAEELVREGAISTLQKRLTPLGAEHSFDNQEKDVTVFYARDRGEEMSKQVYVDFDDYTRDDSTKQGYDYIFRDGEWQILGVEVYRVSTLLAEQKDDEE